MVLVPLSEEYWKSSLWHTSGLNVRGAPYSNKSEGTGCWLSWLMLLLLGCGLAAPVAPWKQFGLSLSQVGGAHQAQSAQKASPGAQVCDLGSLVSRDVVCRCVTQIMV